MKEGYSCWGISTLKLMSDERDRVENKIKKIKPGEYLGVRF